jgi:hypothetical protein
MVPQRGGGREERAGGVWYSGEAWAVKAGPDLLAARRPGVKQ